MKAETNMTSTSENVTALYELLANQADAYRELIELTRQEHQALQHEDVAGLAEVTFSKETIVDRLGHWDSAREQLTASVASALKLPSTTPLSDIIAHLDQPTAEKLSALRQEFIDLFEQLLGLAHGNRLLLESGLARVNATFDHISALAVPSDGQYTASGDKQTVSEGAAGSVLNWQA